MAAASLLVRLGVDLGNLKSSVDVASREFERLNKSVTGMANTMIGAFPKTMGSEAKNIAGAVSSLAGAFGGLGGVVAGLGLNALAQDFFDTTGALVDLNAQTDISIRDLQRFRFAGEQVGVSLETIVGAVGQLQNRLGSMDKSALGGLDALGLSLKTIQALDPGQQFEVIARRIAEIPDPARRAAVAMDLFGRSGVSLLPLLRSDLKTVGDQAAVVSDRTVLAADKFDDMFGRIKNFGKGVVAEGVFGPLVRWADDFSEALGDVGRSIDAVRGKMDELPKALTTPSGFGGKGFIAPTFNFDELMRESDKLDEQLKRQWKSQEDAARRVRETWVSEVRQISNAISGAGVVRDLKQWVEALGSSGAAAKVLADDRLRNELSTAITTVTAKFGSLKAAGLTALQPMAVSLKAFAEQAQTIPPKIIDTMGAFTLLSTEGRSTDAVVKGLTFQMNQMTTTGQVFKNEVGPKIFEGMRDGASKATVQVRSLSQSFVALGPAIANAISGAIQGGGNVFKSIGSTLGQGLTTDFAKFLTASKDDGGLAIGGFLGGAIKSVLPGLGALLGPLVGKIQGALAEAFGGPSKDELLGRDVVAQFEQSLQGSLTAAQKLAAGNESWKLTTIAVRDAYVNAGRSAAEAEAAVKKLWESSKGGADKSRLAVLEIQAVMDIAAAKQKSLGDEITASSKATDAATSALTDKIKGLSAQYDSLFRSIENEAPEEEMGILERKTRDAMASIEREIKSVSQDGFGRMGDAAEDAMRAIEEAFKRGEIKIPIEFVLPDGVRVPTSPAMTSGGSTLPALLGEPEPQAVAPLRPTQGQTPVNLYLDGELVASNTTQYQSRALRSRIKVGVG